jgi:TolB-like protein
MFRWKSSAAFGLTVLALVSWWALKGQRPVSSTVPTSVAILPFQNLGSDKDSDYLRLALPDEMASLLSYVPDLTIRPFAATPTYPGGTIDPQRVGQQLRVATIVTGHFAREGPRIRVTIEAIDASSNRLRWRETVTLENDDYLNLQDQVVRCGRQLAHALVGSRFSTLPATRPRNDEAYDLYLRSMAMPHDGDENRQGIAMLERSIGLDATYAPAWAEAGRRYYYDAQYSDGGMPARRRAEVATERALGLDPNLLDAEKRAINLRAEAGELDKAYDLATRLVQKRPASGEAHFALSYVLRYAGRLAEAGRECDTAMQFDPANAQFRSCALAFEMLGNHDRAREYARLDVGSDFSSWRIVSALLAERQTKEVVPLLIELQSRYVQASLILAYLRRESPERIAELSEQTERVVADLLDPEQAYFDAKIQSFCEQPRAALRQLRRAVEKSYCAFPALDADPLLENVRHTPGFEEVRRSAAVCARRFAVAHGLP